MFDVSPTEFFTIAVIALIVFGPQRLPEIARKLGGYLSEIRKAARDLQSGLNEEVQQLKAPIEELKTDLTQPVGDIKESIDKAGASLDDPAPASQPEVDEAGGKIEWIAPEPEVGVKPDEAWEGMDDEVPPAAAEEAAEPAAPETSADGTGDAGELTA